MTSHKITIETTIAAPVERVWNAYTTPVDITQWNFASDDWCCPGAEVEVEVGGNYRARMEAKDGSVGFDFEAVFEEVVPREVVTLAMSDGRKARTTFEAADGGTKVTTVFDAETQNPLEMQRDGWQAILNNLRSYLEG